MKLIKKHLSFTVFVLFFSCKDQPKAATSSTENENVTHLEAYQDIIKEYREILEEHNNSI